jgi:hypothetical protein
MKNDAQQMERQKIDEKIIQLRPGSRDYRGLYITPLPSNLLEKDKVIASKRGLNPVSWYINYVYCYLNTTRFSSRIRYSS